MENKTALIAMLKDELFKQLANTSTFRTSDADCATILKNLIIEAKNIKNIDTPSQ